MAQVKNYFLSNNNFPEIFSPSTILSLICCKEMKKVYTLLQVQQLPLSLEDAWRFFSDPNNLFTITPPHLKLKPVGELSAKEVYEGQLIAYKVSPILGISVKWISKISKVEEYKFFIDEQVKGPYKLWEHEHFFKEIDGGVEMTDKVQYDVPFGLLGRMMHPVVKSQLDKIFQYRKKKILEMFGELK